MITRLFLLFCLSLTSLSVSAGEDFTRQGRKLIAETATLIKGCENRFEGSPGNTLMSERVKKIFKDADVDCGSTTYEVPVFVPGKAMITVANRKIQLYTLLPNLVELSTFPQQKFSGKLVYVGKGTLREIEGKVINGALCVFDYNCGYNYLDVMPLGAIGCIFIEPTDYQPALAYQKVLRTPLSIPRFQVSRADGKFLRDQGAGSVPFDADIESNRWERRVLENHWALIEGTDPELKRQTVVLYSHLDSMHYCPELPSGATEALNLKLLLDLFEQYRQKPAGRSVLFQVFNSHHQCNFGATEAIFHLLGEEGHIFKIDPAEPSEERSAWRTKIECEYLLEHYPRLAPENITADTIENFSERQDKPAGQTFPLADPIVRHMELALHSASADRIRLHRRGELTEEHVQRIKKIRGLQSDLVTMFNKFGTAKVYDYALIGADSIPDLIGLITELNRAGTSGETSAPQYIWSLFRKETQTAIQSVLADPEGKLAKHTIPILIELNRVIRMRELYREDLWRNCTLSPRTEKLLTLLIEKKLPAADVTQLNRRLLEAAMPGRIEPVSNLESDFPKRIKKLIAQDRKRLKKEKELALKAGDETATPHPVMTEAEARQLVRYEIELKPAQREIFEQYRQRVMEEAATSRDRAALHLERLRVVEKARARLKPFYPLIALGMELKYDNEWVAADRRLGSGNGHFIDASTSIYRQAKIYGDDLINMLAVEAEKMKSSHAIRWGSGSSAGQKYLDMPPSVSCHYAMQRIPALTFLTPFSSSSALLSSNDRLDRISPDIAARKQLFVKELISRVITTANTKDLRMDDKENLTSRIKNLEAGAGEIEVRIADGSSLGRPKTILRNALIVKPLSRSKTYGHAMTALQGGVFGHRLGLSDCDGRAYFYNAGKAVKYLMRAYHIDRAGKINYAVDQGIGLKKNSPIWEPVPGFSENQLLATIRCRKADIYNLRNPKTLACVASPIFQKAKGGMLEKYSLDGMEPGPLGLASVFFDDDLPAKLLFTGSVNLLNTNDTNEDTQEGVGFSIEELNRTSAPLLASKDAISLNTKRIKKLISNAVTNSLMVDLQDKSKKWRNGADGADSISVLQDKGNHIDAFRRTMKGYGAAFSAYPVVNSTISDMMKAVIFYLAVLIPFAFFLQRLLFSFVRVEAQIASFAGLFILTYMIFHSIHPAFKIAKNPQIVLIAFTMLTLAGFVSLCLKGKFDYHMEDFKARFQSDEDVGILKLAGTAMLIGVTNMKRRKLRTTLTCLTIVLITFTMLSFTSVSQSVSPTRILKGRTTPYNGVMFSQQVWGKLDRTTVSVLTEILGKDCPSIKRGFIAYDKPEKNALMLTPLFEDPIPMQGLLALQKKEDGWLRKMPVTGGRYFSSDDAMEVMVTEALAKETLRLESIEGKVSIPADTWLTINGVRLKLVGILDGNVMEDMVDLRGSSIVPQQVSGTSNTNIADAKEKAEEEVPEGTFQNIAPASYVVVPFGIRDLLNIPIVSVSIKMASSQDVWSRVLEFAHYSDNKVYFGTDSKFTINPEREEEEEAIEEMPGRYFLGTGFATSIGGLSSLIIPLLVSATIIFNTMLGAVYERKKEIGIYNAIGLNPVHIALFFVAEAIVYGLIGGVGGYLIGQVLAKVIVYTNLLPDINLNYSSLTVVYVILFTMAIVIVSAIYPALIAMRTASSSSGRKSIEMSEENLLKVQFPYSFTREMAIAVNSYLKEYFDRHCDSSVGDFVAVELDMGREEDPEGNMSVYLKYDVALAPYDLGVTQIVTVVTNYNQRVGAFMVEASSERISGQESNWVATNHPFMNGIRKYLLHWRILSREGQESHMAEGMKMFDLNSNSDTSSQG